MPERSEGKMPERSEGEIAEQPRLRRLLQKTTVHGPMLPPKDVQEALEIPPPDVPRPVGSSHEQEQGSQGSSYESIVEQPQERSPQDESPASTTIRKKPRRWAFYSPSGSETEMPLRSVDAIT